MNPVYIVPAYFCYTGISSCKILGFFFFIFIIAITTRASPLGIPRDIYSGVAQNKVDVSCVDVVFL